jgi:hypothetical protein
MQQSRIFPSDSSRPIRENEDSRAPEEGARLSKLSEKLDRFYAE